MGKAHRVHLAVCKCGPEYPVESLLDENARKEFVRVLEVGRIKRSADPAWNFDSVSGENQCRIGVAALLDPAYSLGAFVSDYKPRGALSSSKTLRSKAAVAGRVGEAVRALSGLKSGSNAYRKKGVGI